MIFGTRKAESLGYRMVKKIADKFNRLSRVHQRHRQQTDGIAMASSDREREFMSAKNEWNKLSIGSIASYDLRPGMPMGNWQNHASFTRPKKFSATSQTVATTRIAPKICQGQPPIKCSQCSRIHPNRFSFSGIIAERVNAVFCPIEYFHYRLFKPIKQLEKTKLEC